MPGIVVDKYEFRSVNNALLKCVKITDTGDTEFEEGEIVPAQTVEDVNAQIEDEGGSTAKTGKPRPATSSTQLLGITKAAVQSESFISAASFQETTKVLTEAALAGKVDPLRGLKENVILGHLDSRRNRFPLAPAGRSPDPRESALQELREEKDRILAARLNLLSESQEAPKAERDGDGEAAADAKSLIDVAPEE